MLGPRSQTRAEPFSGGGQAPATGLSTPRQLLSGGCWGLSAAVPSSPPTWTVCGLVNAGFLSQSGADIYPTVAHD